MNFDHFKLEDAEERILFLDITGNWAPLTSLYFSHSSHELISRLPESCIEEHLGFSFCPQCMTRFHSDEARKYGNRCPTCHECPICFCVLIIANDPFSSSSETTAAAGAAAATLQCSHCGCQVHTCTDSETVVQKVSIENEAAYKRGRMNTSLTAPFSALLQAYSKSVSSYGPDSNISGKIIRLNRRESKSSLESSGERRDIESVFLKPPIQPYSAIESSLLYRHANWDVLKSSFNVDAGKLYTSHCSSNLSSCIERESSSSRSEYGAVLSENLSARRIRLISRRILRCRKDVELGNLSILLQPKTFPLEGDSSQKLQRGKWWTKDSSAIHVMPRMLLRKKPTIEELQTEKAIVRFSISNPRDSGVRLSFFTIDEEGMPSNSDGLEISDSTTIFSRYVNCNNNQDTNLRLSRKCFSFELAPFEDELLMDESDSIFQKEMLEADEDSPDKRGIHIDVSQHSALVDLPISLIGDFESAHHKYKLNLLYQILEMGGKASSKGYVGYVSFNFSV